MDCLQNLTDLEQSDFLCVLGIRAQIYTEVLPWLDENFKRRLVFIYDQPEAIELFRQDVDAILALSDRRVKFYSLESSLQLESLAKQIAWRAIFLEMKIIELESTPLFVSLKKLIEQYHLGAHLLLSDAADCGLSLFRNLISRLKRPIRSALNLKGAFSSIPAVIVGAGPSLEKNRDFLKEISDQALIFVGGSALNVLDFPSHFAASIDSQASYAQFKQSSFWEVPFCFQSRMNPANFSLVHGEAFLAPESHFSFINWLDGVEDSFEGGWTVGNFLTALAAFWGCNPIVFVGMDFCYHLDQKYAHITSPGLEKLRFVDGVWTQNDWLMARQWTQELAQKLKDVTFINATEGGMGLSHPIQTRKLREIDFGPKRHLSTLVHQAIQSTPFLSSDEQRWAGWKRSLQTCLRICDQGLASEENLEQDFSIEDEIVYQKFLDPLWNLWRPIFERELELDPHGGHEEKLRIHQLLFFQKAIQEQLHELQ